MLWRHRPDEVPSPETQAGLQEPRAGLKVMFRLAQANVREMRTGREMRNRVLRMHGPSKTRMFAQSQERGSARIDPSIDLCKMHSHVLEVFNRGYCVPSHKTVNLQQGVAAVAEAVQQSLDFTNIRLLVCAALAHASEDRLHERLPSAGLDEVDLGRPGLIVR